MAFLFLPFKREFLGRKPKESLHSIKQFSENLTDLIYFTVFRHAYWVGLNGYHVVNAV